jgi:hypothetical protein
MRLTRWYWMGSALLVAALVSASPTAADDLDTCDNASGDVAIAACTRGIVSGRYQGHRLAALYYNRGFDWNAKGERDHAVADYDQRFG